MNRLIPFVFAVIACRAGLGQEVLNYNYKVNQTLCYDIEVSWTSASGTRHRYKGQPMLRVKMARNDDYRLMVVGRLRYSSATDKSGKWTPQPSRDWWLGTVANVGNRSGGIGKGSGQEICPESVSAEVSQLLFPTLPTTSTGSSDSGETLKEIELRSNGLQFSSQGWKGTASRKTKASPVGGGRVKLVSEGKYARDDGSKVSTYRAVRTFNNRTGCIEVAASVSQETVGRRSTKVSARAKLITDPARKKKALAMATADFSDLPNKLVPYIFLRKPIKTVALPVRYTKETLPKPGTVVGFYTGGYWVAARYLGVLSRGKNRGKAKIELLGSGETHHVHIGLMAIPNKSRVTSQRTTSRSR